MLTFSEYQTAATTTADYPLLGENALYPAVGAAGEAGELLEKVKKLWRNKGTFNPKEFSAEDLNAVVKEAGDVLWYLAALANEIKVPLGEIAVLNLDKLRDRQARGVIKSEGDNR